MHWLVCRSSKPQIAITALSSFSGYVSTIQCAGIAGCSFHIFQLNCGYNSKWHFQLCHCCTQLAIQFHSVLRSVWRLQRLSLSYPSTRLSINALLDVFLEVFCHSTHKPLKDIPICCLFCRYSTWLISKFEKLKCKFSKLLRKNYNCECSGFICAPNTASSQNWS